LTKVQGPTRCKTVNDESRFAVQQLLNVGGCCKCNKAVQELKQAGIGIGTIVLEDGVGFTNDSGGVCRRVNRLDDLDIVTINECTSFAGVRGVPDFHLELLRRFPKEVLRSVRILVDSVKIFVNRVDCNA